MGSIKHRVTKLEASAPQPAEERITEIHRVIVNRFDDNGAPVIIVRRLA